jgi:hypothetical protein
MLFTRWIVVLSPFIPLISCLFYLCLFHRLLPTYGYLSAIDYNNITTTEHSSTTVVEHKHNTKLHIVKSGIAKETIWNCSVKMCNYMLLQLSLQAFLKNNLEVGNIYI